MRFTASSSPVDPAVLTRSPEDVSLDHVVGGNDESLVVDIDNGFGPLGGVVAYDAFGAEVLPNPLGSPRSFDETGAPNAAYVDAAATELGVLGPFGIGGGIGSGRFAPFGDMDANLYDLSSMTPASNDAFTPAYNGAPVATAVNDFLHSYGFSGRAAAYPAIAAESAVRFFPLTAPFYNAASFLRGDGSR